MKKHEASRHKLKTPSVAEKKKRQCLEIRTRKAETPKSLSKLSEFIPSNFQKTQLI